MTTYIFHDLKDGSSFRFIKDGGKGNKKIFSRKLWCSGRNFGYGLGYELVYAHLYTAYYTDQLSVEFPVDARIRNAKMNAIKYATILGRIPSVFRRCLKFFSINSGTSI